MAYTYDHAHVADARVENGEKHCEQLTETEIVAKWRIKSQIPDSEVILNENVQSCDKLTYIHCLCVVLTDNCLSRARRAIVISPITSGHWIYLHPGRLDNGDSEEE
jgi:hypothetical protein